MSAGTKNFTIEQKATFRKRLTYRDRYKKPINLTSFRAHMQIRDAAGNLISTLSTENGKITIVGTTGVIDLFIPHTETAVMSFTTALYDLKLVAPDGSESRLIQGKVTLSPGQTE